MIRFLLSTLLVAATAACTLSPQVASAPPAATPLIERAKFFGNPTKTGARLSPDGQWLSWIAPRDGVLNVWVAPVSHPDQARPLTAEKLRPIRTTFWSPDSKMVLFVNDKGGDENFLLYGVDVASGEQRSYTPFEKTRVLVLNISRKVKDRILVGINNRDPRWHDVYSLELASAKLTLVQRNDGYAGFVADADLRLHLAEKARHDGGVDYHRIRDGQVEATALTGVDMEDSQTTGPQGFTIDGKTLYWTDSRGRDTAALVAQDVASGATRVLAQDPRADIGSALYDPTTGRVQAYQVDYLKSEYVPLNDAAMAADLSYLKTATQGEFEITSRTDADDKWLLAVDRVTAPLSTWLYERGPRRLTQLFMARPELEGAPLVQMYPHEIKSRDGLTLVSYLSLPKAADPADGGKPLRPVPMVLFVHGGPWARDNFGYHSYHQ